MAPPPKSARKVKMDNFVGIPEIMGLNNETFYDYLTDQKIALIMFYDPKNSECQRSKPHFVKASRTNEKEGSLFAAVDCSENPSLCKEERVRSLPSFKLYAFGRHICDHKHQFDYIKMKEFIEETPFFPPPDRRDSSEEEKEKSFGFR